MHGPSDHNERTLTTRNHTLSTEPGCLREVRSNFRSAWYRLGIGVGGRTRYPMWLFPIVGRRTQWSVTMRLLVFLGVPLFGQTPCADMARLPDVTAATQTATHCRVSICGSREFCNNISDDACQHRDFHSALSREIRLQYTGGDLVSSTSDDQSRGHHRRLSDTRPRQRHQQKCWIYAARRLYR
jgi:hypothetical protein